MMLVVFAKEYFIAVVSVFFHFKVTLIILGVPKKQSYDKITVFLDKKCIPFRVAKISSVIFLKILKFSSKLDVLIPYK